MAKAAHPNNKLADRGLLNIRVLLGAILVLVTACYLPVLRYFFAQDDFMLLYASKYRLGEHLAQTFGPVAYHFRPLTEFLYFAGAYKLFGLNPVPYHVISLLIHLANTVLMFMLLRRFRIGAAASLVATALFGASVAWLHVVGWITSIQQLLPQFFLLLSFWLAARALETASRRDWFMSAAAYLAALFCYEQQALAPVSIWLIAIFGLTGQPRLSIRQSVKALWPHFAILVVYGAVRVFWKGIPFEGRARFTYESNVLDNLVQYLGAMVDFWPTVTGLISWEPFDYRLTHIIFAGLVVYLLQNGRWREVVFGLTVILTMILPVLFMERHYYYYHTYASSFGAIYLVALAAVDGFRGLSRLRIKTPRAQLGIAAVVIVIIAGLSFWKIRVIEKRLETENHPNRVSFVLHRALMAGQAYNDLMAKAGDMRGVRGVQLLLGQPGEITGKAFTPFMWALAQGQAINLFFDNGELEVNMDAQSGIDPKTYETPERRLFYYNTFGMVYTVEEVLAARENHGD